MKLKVIRSDRMKRMIKMTVLMFLAVSMIVIPKNVTGFHGDRKTRDREGVFPYCDGLKEIIIKSKKLDHLYEGSWNGVEKTS